MERAGDRRGTGDKDVNDSHSGGSASDAVDAKMMLSSLAMWPEGNMMRRQEPY
jgi:hypothetical protein